MFIKNYLYKIHDISTFELNLQDVLLVQFKDQNLSYSFVICIYYLPPENNINSRISQEFFDYLTNIIFKIEDFDMRLFTGDMNARCGNESDFVAVIDSNYLPKRILIDETKNCKDLSSRIIQKV